MTTQHTSGPLEGFTQRLLDECLDEVEHRRAADTSRSATPTAGGKGPRRPRLRSAMLLATAAALVTAVAVALPVLRPTDSASAQVITVTSTPDGRNVVTFPGGDPETGNDPETDGRRIAENLRRSGLDVKVNEIPVSPSFVGDTFGYDFPPGEGLAETEAGLTIDPEVYDGTVVVNLGVTPGPGQAYERFGDAFSPGEPLAGLPCVLDDRGDVATFERLVREAGVEVEWHFLSFEDDDRPRPPQAGATVPEDLQNFLYMFVADVRYLPEGPSEGMVVGQAATIAENKVAVTMVWPGNREYDSNLQWSLYRGESEDPLPELAEADRTLEGGLCGPEATRRWK